MPNGIAHDIYVIGPKQTDGTLPNETKIHDERVFFTREDAVEALDDFQPYMRDNFEVYAAHLHIAGISHDTPFVLPTNDDDTEQEDDSDDTSSTGASSTPELSAAERAALYNTCRQALANWCQNNRQTLDGEFAQSLTNSEFADACDATNWLTSSERDSTLDPDEYDYDDVMGWSFDCEPFDDNLRGYVRVDDQGNVTHVVVQGE